MKTIITTVGISLFTGKHNDYRKDIEGILNDDLINAYESEYDEFMDIELREIKKILGTYGIKDNSSAEIESILNIANNEKGVVKKDEAEVRLISTDTVLSRFAAELIKEYLENEHKMIVHFEKEKDVIKELQVMYADKFEQEGLMNLIDRFNTICSKEGNDSILNITGGFKAVIPYLTFYAQLNGIPIYYVFEESQELIQIPYFPVNFDFDVIEREWMAFDLCKKSEAKNRTINDFKQKLIDIRSYDEFIYEKKLIKEKGESVEFTVIGKLLYDAMKRDNDILKVEGAFIELKVFEYWCHILCGKSSQIEHSKKFNFGENEGEADIFITNYPEEGRYTIIECKKSSRFNREVEQNFINKFIPRLKQYNPEIYNNAEFQVWLYPYIHPVIRRLIGEIDNDFQQKHQGKNITWSYLDLDLDYRKKTRWKAKSKLKPL